MLDGSWPQTGKMVQTPDRASLQTRENTPGYGVGTAVPPFRLFSDTPSGILPMALSDLLVDNPVPSRSQNGQKCQKMEGKKVPYHWNTILDVVCVQWHHLGAG